MEQKTIYRKKRIPPDHWEESINNKQTGNMSLLEQAKAAELKKKAINRFTLYDSKEKLELEVK